MVIRDVFIFVDWLICLDVSEALGKQRKDHVEDSVRRSDVNIFEYEGLSNCTEDFLWENEDEVLSDDGVGMHVGTQEEGSMSNAEGEIGQPYQNVALNVHVQINGRQLPPNEKVGLLTGMAGIPLARTLLVDLAPLREKQEGSGDSIVSQYLKSRDEVKVERLRTLVIDNLSPPIPSNVYCFCCGMRCVESTIQRKHQWEFGTDSDDEEGESIEVNNDGNPVTKESSCVPIGTANGKDTQLGSHEQCTCCGRPVDFMKSCSVDTVGSKRRKIESSSLQCQHDVIVKLIDFNSAVQTVSPELYIYDSGKNSEECLHD